MLYDKNQENIFENQYIFDNGENWRFTITIYNPQIELEIMEFIKI